MIEVFEDGTDRDPEEDSTAVAIIGDNDGDGDHLTECSKHQFRLTAADFVQPWTKISAKKVRLVRLKQNFVFCSCI